MPRKGISIEEVHALIGKALREGVDPKASNWANSKERVMPSRPTRNSLYQRVIRSRFLGHGNWYNYLCKRHGVELPASSNKGTEVKLSKLTNPEFHAFVRSAIEHFAEIKTPIQIAGEQRFQFSSPPVSASDWRGSKAKFRGLSLGSIFMEASCRNSFFGHKRWHVYLEKELGITPLYHQPWTDERFHRTIAALAEKYPLKGDNKWRNQKPVLHSRSLHNYYITAFHGNKPKGKGEKWFGHPSFKEYAEWAVENYGSKSG